MRSDKREGAPAKGENQRAGRCASSTCIVGAVDLCTVTTFSAEGEKCVLGSSFLIPIKALSSWEDEMPGPSSTLLSADTPPQLLTKPTVSMPYMYWCLRFRAYCILQHQQEEVSNKYRLSV